MAVPVWVVVSLLRRAKKGIQQRLAPYIEEP